MSMRYYDMINHNQKPKDNRTGDEVVVDIATRAGLELV